MIAVPQRFAEMPRWWHDTAGRAWLGDLPRLVEAQCARWRLEVHGSPWHGSNALVVPVRRGVERFALRFASPGDNIDAEAAALRFWAGRGTVRLIEADATAGAMLLERLDGSRTLADEPLPAAIEVLAHLIVELAVPAPASVPSTADIARDCAGSFERDWIDIGRPVSRAHLERAVAAAIERADATPGPHAVNGDWHFEQVLAGERMPWLVVDPTLLRGDPEYDVARILWSRLDEFADDRAVLHAFDTIVRIAGAPRERAIGWVVIRSMSYLLWGLRDGLTIDPPRCRRLLDLFAGPGQR